MKVPLQLPGGLWKDPVAQLVKKKNYDLNKIYRHICDYEENKHICLFIIVRIINNQL